MNKAIHVEADPRKPYKLYAGMISSGITSFIASGVSLNPYLEAAGVALVAALAVYLTPNPLKDKEEAPAVNNGDLYLGE